MKLFSNRRAYDKRRRLPQNAETKNPKVMMGSLAAIVISAVVLCMVVVIGVVGISSDSSKPKVQTVTASVSAKGAAHAWFVLDSNEAKTDDDTFTMDGKYLQRDGVSFLPADGVAKALGGTAAYDSEKGTVKFNHLSKSAKATVDSADMRVGFFKTVTFSAPVFAEDGIVYVPARDFLEALGYGLTYTAPTKRLDVFARGGGNAPPVASFSTEKDSYNVGEKIVYSVDNTSPQDYAIVEEKWENRADWFFEAGKQTITYAVKDYRGNWSEPVERTITVTGEYHPATTVPVLTYSYITPNDEDISQVVKKEKVTKEEVPDPDDPTGVKKKTKEKREWVNETVRGPYYGDDRVITIGQFHSEVDLLADLGCKTITVSEYIDYINSGVMPPENSVILLFVGGYASTYQYAYPLLKDYGYRATVAPEIKPIEDRSNLVAAVDAGEEGAESALTEFDDGSDFTYLTFAQLKEMVDEGDFEVGAASYDSNDYGDNAALLAAATGDEDDEAYAQRVTTDVDTAFRVLKEKLGEANDPFFVYPYGESSDTLIEALKKINYTAAFRRGGNVITAESDRFQLERYNVTQATGKGTIEGFFED